MTRRIPDVDAARSSRDHAARPPVQPRMTGPEPSAPPISVMMHAPDRVHSLKRVGVNLQTRRRSLILGGAFVLVVLAGAGVMAWAATPLESQPATVETGQVQSTRPAPGSSANPRTAARSTSAAPVPAAPVTPLSASAATAIPADHGPATVSLLAPGDSGFGWPSTAFGSPPGGR